MNEVLEEGKRRYDELRQRSPEFRRFIEARERAAQKSGMPFTERHKWSLALVFKHDSEEKGA